MKSICILCSLYPNEIHPSGQVFVQQLVWAFADMGVKCTVICPTPVNQYPELKKLPDHVVESSPNGKKIDVFFPKIISFGQKNILGLKTARLTTFTYYSAVQRVLKNVTVKPEVVYGHFFTPGGISAARIGKKYNIPSFVAYGESSPWSIFNYGLKKIKGEVDKLAGVVSVSTANKIDLEKLDIVNSEIIQVFPNGIRTDHFYARDQCESRKMFGFPKEDFIIVFTGHFSDRKGVLRLRDAVEGIDGVKVIYAGKGELDPVSDNIIYKGLVKPEQMPYLLSSADIFVLPTLNEGCSNAIVEAVACGLPVISSDLPFNKDILDQENSILIDPNSVLEIRNAILRLKNEKGLKNSLKEGALARSKDLSLQRRALNIKNWIESLINK